jgi:hypothetical protein
MRDAADVIGQLRSIERCGGAFLVRREWMRAAKIPRTISRARLVSSVRYAHRLH